MCSLLGIDIWASKCEKELNWQNAVGVQSWLRSMDQRIQELGGFGVYRFLENLFHAFEALFEASSYSDENADEALTLLQRIRKVSTVSVFIRVIYTCFRCMLEKSFQDRPFQLPFFPLKTYLTASHCIQSYVNGCSPNDFLFISNKL